MTAQKILVDFAKETGVSNWQIVNDGVMGGLSQSNIALNNNQHAIFSGTVSLENNGGFASVRHRFDALSTKDYDAIIIRIKGDGKRYQLRIKTNWSDRHSYITYFTTTGEWQELTINLAEMYPTFRGRELDMPNYKSGKMEEIAILIANKKSEAFALEIDYIKLK